MAHNVEPMDIDIDSDFDNKENSIQHSNVYPRTPCTEKGYEELDVSELNMKLRYSVTPVSSPMSKSYTANSADNNNFASNDDTLNANLTRSYNSTLSKTDVVGKSFKSLPLQSISADQMENSRSSLLRSLDPIKLADVDNVTVTVTSLNENEDNFETPSSSSSMAVTPDATTPTKEVPRSDGGSPIMRGLKSVLNMFRSSQSPIPPSETENSVPKQILSPTDVTPHDSNLQPTQAVLASTPIASHKIKESTRRSSPLKESIIFNDDLEKELLWKDETTILFSQEKIPVHKLFYPQPFNNVTESVKPTNIEKVTEDNLNVTVEYMDISSNNSIVKDHTLTDIRNEEQQIVGESDGEFVDCETTFTNDKSGILNDNVNETESNSAIHSSLSTHNNQTHIQSLQQNQSASASNTEIILSETYHKIGDFDSSQPTTALDEYTLKTDTPQEKNTNKHETHNSVTITEESHILREEAMCVSSASSQHKNNIQELGNLSQADINKDILHPHEITKIIEPKSVSGNTTIVPDEPITDSIAMATPSNVTAVEKDEICNSINTAMKPEEIIQQTHDSQNLNATLETSCLHAQSAVKDKEIALNQTTNLEMLSDIDSSNKNQPEINECNQVSNDPSLLVLEQNKESSFAADIPLPEEDNFELEIQSNADDLTFTMNNEIIYPELETTPSVDNMPNNSMAWAKRDENKVICGDIDGNSASLINMQVKESDIKETFISTDENVNGSNNNSKITETLHYFTSGLKTDNENCLRDTEQIVKKQLNKLAGDAKFEDFKLDNSLKYNAKSELNALEVEHVDIPLEAHNVDNTKVFVQDETLKSVTPFGECSERIIKDKVFPENQENEIAPANVIPDNVTLTSPANTSNVIACDKTESKSNILIKNNETFFCVSDDHCEEMNCEAKTELLPDVISDIIVSNDPDETAIADNKDTTEKKIGDYIKETISEIVNSDTMFKIKAIEDNIDEELILSENNSPFVSIADQINCDKEQSSNLEKNDLCGESKKEVARSPPISPKICSKGYNFNFDETDDPFSTKTRIRLSPPPNSPKDNVIEEINKDIPKNFITKNRQIEEKQYSKNKRISTGLVEPTNIAEKENDKKIDSITQLEASSKSQSNLFCELNNEDILIKSEKIKDLNIEQSLKSKPEILMENEKGLDGPTNIDVARSPPISPKICSKGYNFNFDEIDDPFSTKTRIRLSPPPNFLKDNVKEEIHKNIPKNFIIKNRQIEEKQYSQNKRISTGLVEPTNIAEKENDKKIDSITQLDASSKSQSNLFCELNNEDILIKSQKIKDLNIEQSLKSKPEILMENEDKEQNKGDALLNVECNKDVKVLTIEENKVLVDSLTSSNDIKQASSSEQSTYYSAETSGDNNKHRNVFNIPEIDDTNPFLTKSKICESPPPSKSESSSSLCNNPSQECNETNKTPEALDKDSSNISNISCSSKTTEEKDITVREVHTEDEDTIEGPFLEDDDLNNVDKVSDFDGEDMDMMQFSELPAQTNEEQPEGEEMFIDAEAFEFLLNQNKTNMVTDSGKESLFLKFDPLFAKRVSTDGVRAALNNVQKRQSTPRKVSVAQQLDITFEKPVAGPSTLNVTQKRNINDSVGDNIEDLNVIVSKPMMVVTPAVNPVVTPRNKSLTPTSSNRRSITFSSPAIAVIDRLLSLSGNNSFLGHDSTIIQGNREQNEAEHALSQLRELLAEKEIHVYNLRSESKELKNRLSTLESQMRILESESEERLKKINDLNDKLSEKTKLNKSMAAVVEEYERTIASLIAESEQDKKRHNEERSKLVKERDEQTAHLASMEVSFNDLHSKYEKSKQVILTCKANEDACKKSIKEFEENLTKMQSNYELLKQHATSKLNHANQELEKMNRAHEAEVLKLNAMIKRKELHITSLEETLAQKTKANEELTAICDELINKVG